MRVVGALGDVYRSSDGGRTWIHVGVELGDGVQCHGLTAVAVDPLDPAIVHAASRRMLLKTGVFVSRDGAETWRPLNDGLLAAPVHALAIDPRDGRTLLAGTEGGGVPRLLLE